jgi:hypothetical protein
MSGWTDALTVVKKLAPSIASVIGGPLAGGAITALETVFGMAVPPNTAIDDRQNAVAAAINGATPEQLAAMRKADQDYAARMAEAGFKNVETLASLTVQDRENARQMQVNTKGIVAPFLALFVTLGFFGVLALMVFHPLPQATHDALMLMLGSLGTAWTGVIAYYFGSSAGSDRKTELLAQSTSGTV